MNSMPEMHHLDRSKLAETYPGYRVVGGVEGAAVYAAETPDEAVLIFDEGVLVDVLDDDVADLVAAVSVRTFPTVDDRDAYAVTRGLTWDRPDIGFDDADDAVGQAAVAAVPTRLPMQDIVLRVLKASGSPLDNMAVHDQALAALDPEVRAAFESSALGRQRFRERLASAKSNLKKAGQAWLLDDGRWEASGVVDGPKAAGGTRRIGEAFVRKAERLIALFADSDVPSDLVRVDLGRTPVSELLRLHPAIVAELREREVIRSNNLVGEYAERLVVGALGGQLMPVAGKGHDVVAPIWMRVQVKARLVSDPSDNSQLQLGIIRGRGHVRESFDHLAVVLFDKHMSVGRAVLLPADLVESLLGPLVVHVNGRTMFAPDRVMFHEQAVDITDAMRAVARSLDDTHDWSTTAELSTRGPIAGR